jgi:hypothetical protein
MSKNSRAFNNVPFAPVCAALTTSTGKESSVMINRCSTLNFGRSKDLRTDHTGALSQACIACRRSSTGTARSNSIRDMNVYRRFLLYLCCPVYLKALRWTNSRLRIPTKYLQTRSWKMYPLFWYVTLSHRVFGSWRFETTCPSHLQQSKRPSNPKRKSSGSRFTVAPYRYIDQQKK